MKAINFLALTLLIVGGINWLLVGAIQFDLVAYIFGGQAAPFARIIYGLVGLSAIWCMTFYRHVGVYYTRSDDLTNTRTTTTTATTGTYGTRA